MLMKMKGKICVEKEGFKVGDLVGYEDDDVLYNGYVAVIDPDKCMRGDYFLLRLKDYNGHNGDCNNGDRYSKKSWFPKKEKGDRKSVV